MDGWMEGERERKGGGEKGREGRRGGGREGGREKGRDGWMERERDGEEGGREGEKGERGTHWHLCPPPEDIVDCFESRRHPPRSRRTSSRWRQTQIRRWSTARPSLTQTCGCCRWKWRNPWGCLRDTSSSCTLQQGQPVYTRTHTHTWEGSLAVTD